MRIPLLFAALFALLAAVHPAAAARLAAIVVDADSGQVLHAQDATEPWYPASLTKVMTLYLTFAAIEAGQIGLTDEMEVSEHAASQSPTKLGLMPGEKIKVREAILAVITRSANDAAVVLAEHLAGSEEAFAAKMTETAGALGMARTRFRNATGLPDPGQVTTARDMAVLAHAMLRDFPLHYHFFSSRSFSFEGRALPTYNAILTSYPGADGIKTGFTCGAGYNLIASAKRDGRRLIGVVLGGKSRSGRNSEMARLLDLGFDGGDAGFPPPVLLRDLRGGVPGHETNPPADRFSSSECTRSPNIVSPHAPGGDRDGVGTRLVMQGADGPAQGDAADAKQPKLSGWGLIFGAFPKESLARASIKDARGKLKPVLKGGRPAVVKRKWEGATTYKALLVGLSREQAGSACKHLWNAGAYCLALSPEVLTSPGAMWR